MARLDHAKKLEWKLIYTYCICISKYIVSVIHVCFITKSNLTLSKYAILLQVGRVSLYSKYAKKRAKNTMTFLLNMGDIFWCVQL